MIYMGDGLTDVPCMILVKENGGYSIAVYPKGSQEKVAHLFEDGRVNYICKADYSSNSEEKVAHLFEDGRVNYICKADYSSNSELEKVVKLIVDSISIRETLELKREKTEKQL